MTVWRLALETAPPFPELGRIIAYAKWLGLAIVMGSLIVAAGRLADARQRGTETEGVRAILTCIVAGIVIAVAPTIVNEIL